jgi:hypothetical protein
MLHDPTVLVREIYRLQNSRNRWRAVAIAALALVFAALVPFTIVFGRVVAVRQEREMAVREQAMAERERVRVLEKLLREKAKEEGK